MLQKCVWCLRSVALEQPKCSGHSDDHELPNNDDAFGWMNILGESLTDIAFVHGTVGFMNTFFQAL